MSVKVSGITSVSKRLSQFGDDTEKNLKLMVGAFSGRLEAKAVRDRSWTDRTNAARNSITSTWALDNGVFIVVLAIGVEYGIFLETARGGKYRVIRPTVDAMREEFRRLPGDAMEASK